MRQQLTPEGFANIFANLLGQGLERLADPDEGPGVYAIGDLPTLLLEATCNNLRIRSRFEDAYVVALNPSSAQHLSPAELARRLGDPDAHMVLFVPEEARAGADLPLKGCIPVDTFRNLEIMEEQLIKRINKVPVYKRVATLWSQHAMGRIPIVKRLEYLINVVGLCVEAEEMGTFFHQIDLLPDRNPDVTGNFADRLARNVLAMAILCGAGAPAATRVAALHLEDAALARRLEALLAGIGEPTPATLAGAVFQAECGNPEAGLSFDHWRFSGEPGWT
ncbi:MAG: hypothetical protein HZA24_04880 [Nitrospirae bacterium]|nr:hypothetical protein [Nitrospirota bacterium]